VTVPDPQPPPFPDFPLTTRAWREESLTRAAELETLSSWLTRRLPDDLTAGQRAADAAVERAIAAHVAAARSAATEKTRRWNTGAAVAKAASHLDAAEADLLRRVPLDYLRGQLPGLYAHVRRHLPRDDPRRERVKTLVEERKGAELTELDRERLIGAVRAASSAAEREQQRVRSFCTIVYAAATGLAVLALLIGVLGWFTPQNVALCFQPQPGPGAAAQLVCPTESNPLTDADGSKPRDVDTVVRTTANHWDVPLVEIIGMVAAGVTGSVGLRRIRGTSTPFGVPVALAVLKLPTGALTAFLGLLLMRGGFVPGLSALDTTPQIVAWAVIFGASQQLFTGLVDQQAQNVLDSVGNKTYVPSGGS
jgi:hypothetical protein